MRRTVTGTDIPDLLRATTRRAAKFEQRDSYLVDEDIDVFERWRRGQAAADEGLEPWLNVVREVTASGRAVQRVRVVTTPPTDYIRFEAAAVPASAAAGEDIRYLPRAAAAGLPDHDFWIFDDAVMILHFAPDDTPLPHELDDDPDVLAQHERWWAAAWQQAIPYAAYAAHLA